MRVVVIGAGVTGVTAAYYLARAGFSVTVIERQPGPGMEASFANAGLLTPGHAEAWASPGTLKKTLRWLGREDGPVKFRPRLDPAQWRWIWRFLRNCTHKRWLQNTGNALRLADYSLHCLGDLRNEHAFNFNHISHGQLMFTRHQTALEGWDVLQEILKEANLGMQVLDGKASLELEPALKGATDIIAGGVYFPQDESGDCHQFTQSLAQICAESMGVVFRYESKVAKFQITQGEIKALHLEGGEEIEGELYVLSAGSYSTKFGADLGVRLPIYPIKGYSITVPWPKDVDGQPRMSMSDMDYKFAMSPMGERLRVAGTAEFAGYDASLSPIRAGAVMRGAQRLFPDGPDYTRAVSWCGLRPATPDSNPVLGGSHLGNLLFNTGHGTMGWTHACGSGQIIADLVAGKTPKISLDGLTMARFN